MRVVLILSVLLTSLVSCAPKAKFSSATAKAKQSSSSIASDPNRNDGLIRTDEDTQNNGGSRPGSNSPGSTPQSNPGQVPKNDPRGLNPCIDGDRIVVPWSGVVRSCLDQGKTFNFETKTCTEMRKASFSCDWATVKSRLEEKGLLTTVLSNDAAAGAKLVSCGQSADGNRIAVQWVKNLPQSGQSCQKVAEGVGITTGCYRYYVDSTPPPAAKTKEEIHAQLIDCMQFL